MLEKIIKVIAELKARYAEKYQLVFFEVTPELYDKNGEKKLVLTGKVLLASQKRRVGKRVQKFWIGELENKIEVITDDKREPLFWGKTGDKLINVFKRPLTNEERKKRSIRKKNRHTQILPGDDPFRVIMKEGNWYLIKMTDGTIGWVRKKRVIRTCDMRTCEHADKRRIIKKEFRKICEKYLGIPYLMGGNSFGGIDCSGLAQRIYKEAFNIILPKKSIKQIRSCEKKLSLEELTWGDLLFFKASNGKIVPHIGICFEENKQLILHSCLKNKQVEIDSLPEMLKWYMLIEIGRKNK